MTIGWCAVESCPSGICGEDTMKSSISGLEKVTSYFPLLLIQGQAGGGLCFKVEYSYCFLFDSHMKFGGENQISHSPACRESEALAHELLKAGCLFSLANLGRCSSHGIVQETK